MSSTVSPRGDVGATGELARRGSKTRIKVRVRKSSSGRVANDGALLDLSDENTNEVDAALSKSSSSAGMASVLVTDVEDAPLRRMRVESTHLHRPSDVESLSESDSIDSDQPADSDQDVARRLVDAAIAKAIASLFVRAALQTALSRP